MILQVWKNALYEPGLLEKVFIYEYAINISFFLKFRFIAPYIQAHCAA
jgi:hypothetical protein